MNSTSLLKKMCEKTLSATDIKAICKNRGFPSKAATSPAVFESYFLSDIGIQNVLTSLTAEEIALLHLLKLEKREVGIDFFESVLPEKQSRWDSTFTKLYAPVFKCIQRSLIRKGVLLTTETGHEDTKMERLRFRFPREFEPFLPSFLGSPSSFQGAGNIKKDVMRKKFLEFMNGIDTSSKESPRFRLALINGELCMGGKSLSVDRLLKWQQETWYELAWKTQGKFSEKLKSKNEAYNFSTQFSDAQKAEKKKFPSIINYALSQLRPGEWVLPDVLSPLLKVFYFGTIPLDGKVVCESGWKQGCLSKHVSGGKNYYRLPENLPVDQDPSTYLAVGESSLTINIQTIPYESLIHIAAIADLKIIGKQITALPHFIRLGRADETFWEHPLTIWLTKHSPLFEKSITKVKTQRGKQIIHENLILAKIKNLSLKVQIQKKFSDPSQILILPNDFIAFPRELRQDISNLVIKSGFVVKTISAYE
ncbi:MAG: hypothetical protein HQ517_00800 [SAR324 cluster bacterium]|nr:hypothetical protein [SAR324 cluster bacterium]